MFNIHRKTPVLDSLFNKVVSLQIVYWIGGVSRILSNVSNGAVLQKYLSQ